MNLNGKLHYKVDEDGISKYYVGSRGDSIVSYKKLGDDVSCQRCYVYKTLWILVIGECLLSEREPDNPNDKYAVCVKKENRIVGHLPLGKMGKFAKTILYFLKADKLSSCKIVVTGQPVNLEEGDGMQ